MKVLLTGAKGQLGSCFQDRLPADWEVWATDSDVLDITDLEKVKRAVIHYQPDFVVNAAAFTAVDKAETEHKTAALINETGPKNLALAANEIGARLVHISTDYVFDGEAITPYIETAKTNPLGVYGKTKLDGEIAVSQIQPDALIIRTAWVFSEYGNNFVKTMLRLAQDRETLGVVSDQFGCPTYAGDIAQAIIVLLQNKSAGGIYHFCGDEMVAWNEFAEVIFSSALQQGVLTRKPVVNGITTEQYPTPAKRPKYSVLDCEKIKNQGVILSLWKSRVDEVIAVSNNK
ncbi:dTDP-4-dehydrorhamnose reductase [compost metagenome]|uniref:dTDP-4-dehydrorhamnose reductase n=1 Tax=Serratia plymuthica S13 TaxID=1348660 RepID=S4YG87_SERPL|nr:dTDP-4-dehydrorhamnose reductase [Serratia plymuthica]AGP43779.1 dTDP-4-dehydrorhamnose reductase [Serratia plymuthica S13]ANJ91988.1 dTDP-4-dehydrorhamnose reductase [Serratia plymuthica]EKF67056.1 dTDP-4-dehydrorhamnose reductase [Serratia plymuthica A30]KYG14813.1 dTDP-4-dehydrorhamnose reductase [Serratia plymuthica]MBI6137453.1 dTDP-4-dehydrorhamnose reductase [Serratia plymuthica]